MIAPQGPDPREALGLLLARAGVSPDEAALEALAADAARLQVIVETVNSVEVADDLDGVLTFDPAT